MCVSDPFMCVSSSLQNGRIPCDADIDRLTLSEGYINGSHHVSVFVTFLWLILYLSYLSESRLCLQFRMEPGQMVQETYTVEEDPQELPPVISVETSEDGTTRRTETTVTRRSAQISTRIIVTGRLYFF